MATPAFLNQPTPFAGLYPLFSQISGTPLVTQFLEDPTPPLISDGVGGGGGFQLCYDGKTRLNVNITATKLSVRTLNNLDRLPVLVDKRYGPNDINHKPRKSLKGIVLFLSN